MPESWHVPHDRKFCFFRGFRITGRTDRVAALQQSKQLIHGSARCSQYRANRDRHDQSFNDRISRDKKISLGEAFSSPRGRWSPSWDLNPCYRREREGPAGAVYRGESSSVAGRETDGLSRRCVPQPPWNIAKRARKLPPICHRPRASLSRRTGTQSSGRAAPGRAPGQGSCSLFSTYSQSSPDAGL